jgi:hypothetical protein
MYLFPINCGVFSTNFLNQLSILSFILSSFNYNTLFLFCQVTIGASLEASIPTGSVQSPTYSSPGSTNKWSVTIPTNIKVVEVQDVGEKSPNYVGVTGGKTYTLTVVVGSNDFYYCYYSSSSKYWIRARDDRARILISWSPTINAKSPNITDY